MTKYQGFWTTPFYSIYSYGTHTHYSTNSLENTKMELTVVSLAYLSNWRPETPHHGYHTGPLMSELTLSTPNLSAICRQSIFYHDSSLLGFGLITVAHGKSCPPSIQSSVCLLVSSTCHKHPPSSGTRPLPCKTNFITNPHVRSDLHVLSTYSFVGTSYHVCT